MLCVLRWVKKRHLPLIKLYDALLAFPQALYDRSGKERKEMLPGGKDKYRETRFQRDDENQTYRIIYSEMEEEKSIVS